MTHDSIAMTQFSSMVRESALERLKDLGLEVLDGPSSQAPGAGSTDDTAAVVAIWGPNVTGHLVVQTAARVLERARPAPESDPLDRLGQIASDLAACVTMRCQASGRDLTAGTPCILTGTGLSVRTSPAGGRLDFASNGGAIAISFEIRVADGEPLFNARTVLVIDDSPAIRQDVTALLASAGYRVLEASDGRDGLDKLAANPEIAMVCCDMNMPNMDGLTFVETAKQRYGDKTVPIVMLTSETRAKLCSAALKKGAVGWIVKPFQPPELLATVQKLARRSPR